DPNTDYDTEVDVPFSPDEPLPLNPAAQQPAASALEPASASSSTPGAAARTGDYALHLVSLTDREAVEGSWAQLQETYPEFLAGKDLAVRQVDLGDRGIFYRLHAAPYAAPESARATCEKLRSLDQYCAVVDLQ
ncbi:MAG: SPOR domain-containing protein, partial [Kiloniellales bacterium]|nr:SPOR domain-containing protein [Kiloniellales bacterium]